MRSLLRLAPGVLCLLPLAGFEVSIAQTPDTTSTVVDSAPSQSWGSCVAALSARGRSSTDLQSMLTRPQNINQFLQNLKLAWENDWLLRPEFYDDETLLKFFNGVGITWKRREHDRFPAEEIAMETSSRVFSQVSVVLEAHCRSRTFPKPNNRQETIVNMGGNFRISVPPELRLTLTAIRQVFGPEMRNELDPDFQGESEVIHPITVKGSVVYTDPDKEAQEGARIGLIFYFGIPSKTPNTFETKIAPADVVSGIVVSDARHLIVGN